MPFPKIDKRRDPWGFCISRARPTNKKEGILTSRR